MAVADSCRNKATFYVVVALFTNNYLININLLISVVYSGIIVLKMSFFESATVT